MTAFDTGRKIQRYRLGKGLTQRQLAEHLHVTDKAVSKWERGRNYPDIAQLPALADALGTTVSELLGIGEEVSQETIDVLAAVSRQEERRIRRSLIWYIFGSMLAGILYLSFRIHAPYPERILLIFTIALLARGGMLVESLLRKFSQGREYYWPEEQGTALWRSVRIGWQLWRERWRKGEDLHES